MRTTNWLSLISIVGIFVVPTVLVMIKRWRAKWLPWWTVALMTLTAGWVLTQCAAIANPSPRIIVRNYSKNTLTNVVVSGSGFSHRVPVIEPGQRVRFRVEPSGESSLSLRFDTQGRTINSGQQGYFEPRSRYRVDAVVQSDLNVTIATQAGWF